jgi:hypothetical protein
MSLLEEFTKACGISSDINEHLPTLKRYASCCSSVVEFGVRGGVSTLALLSGLAESSSSGKQYLGVDVDSCPIVPRMQQLANQNGIAYRFAKEDSAKANIDACDMLFIDTWHVYGHLKRELANNHSKVGNWIILHDTTVDEFEGESIRRKWNTKQQSVESGYPEEEIRKGLWPAVEEFLQANANWKLRERFVNNNGLTVLERDAR